MAQIPNATGSFVPHGNEGGSNLWSPTGVFSGSGMVEGKYKEPPATTPAARSITHVNFNLGGGGGAHNHGLNLKKLNMYGWIRTA